MQIQGQWLLQRFFTQLNRLCKCSCKQQQYNCGYDYSFCQMVLILRLKLNIIYNEIPPVLLFGSLVSAVYSSPSFTAPVISTLVLNMRQRCILWLIVLLSVSTGCRNNKKDAASYSDNRVSIVKLGGVTIKLMNIRQCRYPENSLLVEMKWNKKLLLFNMQVDCENKSNKYLKIPQGAVLLDQKGNSYENQPGVIAMAQNNDCIKSDDIKAYNIIWNGGLKTGEPQTAYVLGFELPEDAIPEKLYWNKEWKNNNTCFVLDETNFTINH